MNYTNHSRNIAASSALHEQVILPARWLRGLPGTAVVLVVARVTEPGAWVVFISI